MFKHAIVYCTTDIRHLSMAQLQDDCFERHPHQPLGPTQEHGGGWIAPRGEEHGELVESIAGHLMAAYFEERRVVPGALLKRRLDEKAKQIEAETGRKPGQKERRDLKEEIKLALLPTCEPKQRRTFVWIDRQKSRIVVGTGSARTADYVISALLETLAPATDGTHLILRRLDNAVSASPVTRMTHHLLKQGDDLPEVFRIGRDAVLRSSDESKMTVKYQRAPLETEEVQNHLMHGMVVESLGFNYDDRLDFGLTDTMQIRNISFLDCVFEGQKSEDKGSFDADVAIMTGELERLLDDLVDVFDGVTEVGDPDIFG